MPRLPRWWMRLSLEELSKPSKKFTTATAFITAMSRIAPLQAYWAVSREREIDSTQPLLAAWQITNSAVGYPSTFEVVNPSLRRVTAYFGMAECTILCYG